MKGTKVLGILAVLAILVLTAILITNNSKKHAAIVTVYPRLPEEGPSPCANESTGGGMFVTVVVEEGTKLCDMSEAQVSKLASVGGYGKKRLCKCINEFCGEKPKPDKFVECLENPNRAS